MSFLWSACLAFGVLGGLLACDSGSDGSGQKKSKNEWGIKPMDPLEHLELLGLYKYADQAAIPRLKLEAKESGWPLAGENGRVFHADAEELAEGGVARFLSEIRPFLEKQGVKLEGVKESFDSGYGVTVGESSFRIYSKEELESGAGGRLWGLSTSRTFALVNSLLESAESGERVYALYGGNDLFAVFLTPELFRAVRSFPGLEKKESPYQATDAPPLFGHPE